MPYIEPDTSPDTSPAAASRARIKKFATILAAVIFFGVSTGKELKALMGPEVQAEIRADVALTGTVAETASLTFRMDKLAADLAELQKLVETENFKTKLDTGRLLERAQDNRDTLRFLELRLREAETRLSYLKP